MSTNENPPSASEKDKPEIPIARNSNPAGVSTARPFSDVPMKPDQEESAPDRSEMPIARNSNPAGVSTARPQE